MRGRDPSERAVTPADCAGCDDAQDVAACTGRTAHCPQCRASWSPDAVMPHAPSVLASEPAPDSARSAWSWVCAAFALTCGTCAVLSLVAGTASEMRAWLAAGIFAAAECGLWRARR